MRRWTSRWPPRSTSSSAARPTRSSPPHWPHTDDPGAEELGSATKHVASTTLTELEWQNSKLIEGDVADGVRKLKHQDGPELQVHGSANLIQILLKHGL